MSRAAKKAVERHRKRLKRRGLRRVEVLVPAEDAERLRDVARALREGEPAAASRLRRALSELALAEREGITLKELLASAPLEGVDLRRPKDLGRDVDL